MDLLFCCHDENDSTDLMLVAYVTITSSNALKISSVCLHVVILADNSQRIPCQKDVKWLHQANWLAAVYPEFYPSQAKRAE